MFQVIPAASLAWPSSDDVGVATRALVPKMASVPIYLSGEQFRMEQESLGFSQLHALVEVTSQSLGTYIGAASIAKLARLADRQRKYVAVDVKSPTKVRPMSHNLRPPKRQKIEEFGATGEPGDELKSSRGVGKVKLELVGEEAADQRRRRNPKRTPSLSLLYSPPSSQQSNASATAASKVDVENDVVWSDEEEEKDELEILPGPAMYSPPPNLRPRKRARETDDEEDLENDQDDAAEDTGVLLFAKASFVTEKADAAQKLAQRSLHRVSAVDLTKIGLFLAFLIACICSYCIQIANSSFTAQRFRIWRLTQPMLEKAMSPLRDRSDRH